MLVVAAGDHLTVSDEALAASVKGFDSASGPARDWFVQHLGRS